MDYMIIVFRARSHTINFANLLHSYKIPCQIINTPRIVNVSCGISVKFSSMYIKNVQQILSRRYFDTFAGIYQVVGIGLNQKVIKIK